MPAPFWILGRRILERTFTSQYYMADTSILFDHMNLQIIKINIFNKIILCEPGLVVTFKILNIGIQPDRLAEVKLITYFIEGMKDFMRSRIIPVVTDNGIF